MKNKRLLFLCDDNTALSKMAEGFANKYAANNGIKVFSAGVTAGKNINPAAITVMKTFGINILQKTPTNIAAFSHLDFDLIVTLKEPSLTHGYFRGLPAIIHWSLVEDLPQGATQEQFMRAAERINRLCADLFENGYLSAFIQNKSNTDIMLNSLPEGLLAHDLNRKIFYFSDRAVELTGLSKESVLGKDCHKIFPGGICGEHCAFCSRMISPDFSPATYPVSFVHESGHKKQCELSVVPLKSTTGEIFGIAASFRDTSELNILKMRNHEMHSFSGIIGQDPNMLEIFQQIRDVADYDFPAHIFGETGTGKELVAAAIHNESPRKNKPFVPVNCGALPESLIESELFGHVRGAFSGAVKDKKGRFELAEGGTIFLDEIAELSKELQVKLLRFLQEATFEKVGGEKTIQANVRVISATNKELKKEVGAGRFREDLYYRLNVIPLNLPALREKRNDIPLLVNHFCEKIARMSNKKLPHFSKQAISLMMTYSWPGNVRELENAVQYSVVRSRGERIEPRHLPMELAEKINVYEIQKNTDKRPNTGKLTLEVVQEALDRTGGNKSRAAKELGVGRATLYRFLDANKSKDEQI